MRKINDDPYDKWSDNFIIEICVYLSLKKKTIKCLILGIINRSFLIIITKELTLAFPSRQIPESP